VHVDQINAYPSNENWTQLMESNPDKDNLSYRNLIEIIPTLGDTQGKLPNLKEMETYKKILKIAEFHNVNTYPDSYRRKPAEKFTVKSRHLLSNSATNDPQGLVYNEVSQHVSPQKLIIIGDSHARGLSSRLKGSLTDDFQVIGYVKPGAAIVTLISSAKRDIANLNKNDVIVFCGGARDISNNNTQNGLRHLMNFVKETKHTNIILISVPHRHDLLYWSCVNKEVETFNRKLIKLIKPLEHVMMANSESNRNYFTSHGMHLNNKGKEQVVREVSKVITSMFLEQIGNSIVLPLKMFHEQGISLNSYVKG
jgi:lysophospholipase L1-like esterase